jgi:hypothetical protein
MIAVWQLGIPPKDTKKRYLVNMNDWHAPALLQWKQRASDGKWFFYYCDHLLDDTGGCFTEEEVHPTTSYIEITPWEEDPLG